MTTTETAIKPSELRLGNWLIIGTTYTQLEEISRWDDLNDVQPIPLTPEILEKAGLKKGSLGGYIIKLPNRENFLDWDSSTGMYLEDRESNGLELDHIQYLHQLQNLYFALTGTELEIDLHGPN